MIIETPIIATTAPMTSYLQPPAISQKPAAIKKIAILEQA
jgi:hypothetical protein